MPGKIVLFLLLALFMAQVSCQKEEKIIHEELILDNNQAPPYNGIPSVLIENYIDKIYIDLLGVQPETSEKDSIVLYLKENKLSMSSRETVIDQVVKRQSYHDRLFQVLSDLMLNGMGVDEINSIHTDYAAIRDLFYQQGDTFTAEFIGFEVEKLGDVLSASQDYQLGSIDLNEYFRRMSFNLIYDEINMGSDNFVISCFENMFKRNPTEDEKKKGVDMVDGISTQILRKEGRTKVDFLVIVTLDFEFYQGRVLDAYRTYLQRDPTSSELGLATSDFVGHENYALLQRALLITDEYAGFK